MKIVIFDLDETLGYFVEFGIFWDCLNKYVSENMNSGLIIPDFNATLDLFPEFIRPNIIPILNYLKHKKQNKCCNKLLIYTNNQGIDLWAEKIISYFEEKIKSKLFDQIISAFKVNGKRLEICRTTHDKTFHDLIKCSKIPVNAEICYMDDTYFPEMSNKNVYYIHVKPYVHDLSFEEMIKRFEKSKYGSKFDKNDFSNTMMKLMNNYQFTFIQKTKEETELDKVVSKEIMIHLQYFFNHSISKNKKTKYKRNKNFNKTRKNNN
jgi:hypothetical protein